MNGLGQLYDAETARLYEEYAQFYEYMLKKYKGRSNTRQVRRSMAKYTRFYWRRKARREARKFQKDLREANLFAKRNR